MKEVKKVVASTKPDVKTTAKPATQTKKK